MKTLTITVSDEMAENLETIRAVFFPGEDLGRALDEDVAGWLLRSIAEDDGDSIYQVIDSLRFDTSDQAYALGERIDSLLERLGHDVPSAWFVTELPDAKHTLGCVFGTLDADILDFAIERNWSFEWLRERFRTKVGELDEQAGLPRRNWTENPPTNVAEILVTIEAEEREKEPASA